MIIEVKRNGRHTLLDTAKISYIDEVTERGGKLKAMIYYENDDRLLIDSYEEVKEKYLAAENREN